MLIRIISISSFGHVSFKFAHSLFITGLQLSTVRVVRTINFFCPPPSLTCQYFLIMPSIDILITNVQLSVSYSILYVAKSMRAL